MSFGSNDSKRTRRHCKGNLEALLNNTEAINKFAKKRDIHITDIADHEPQPSEDTTPEEQHDPHQFDDAPGNESDPIWITSTATPPRGRHEQCLTSL